MKATTAALAAALACLPAGGPALAQSPTWTVGGPAVEGRLEASDPKLGEAEHYDDRRITLRANQRVRLSLESTDFDPVLLVYRPDNLDEPLAENDDGGEDVNARLTFTAPADGDYVVRAMSYEPGVLGRYSLRAEPLPPLPAPVTAHSATAAMTWRLFRGELGPQDPDDNGLHFDDYQVRLREGELMLVAVDSDAFDTTVQVLAAEARAGPVLESDDDGGPDSNSLLGFRAPRAGDYIVRVTSFTAGQSGAYTLRVGN
jgi:hypothetical protein